MSDQKGFRKTAGDVLKEAREAKGISLETVHEMTKIPLDVLKAIEEGYSVRTLSAFYLKGFVKMYAEYLGADISRAVPVVAETELKKKPIKELPKETSHMRRYQKKDVLLTKEQQRLIVQIIGAVIGLFIVFRIGGCLFAKKDVPVAKKIPPAIKAASTQPVIPKPRAVEKPKQEAQPVAQPVSETPKPVPEKSPQPVEKKQEAPVDGVNLTITAKKPGWLQVKVDGIVVLEATVRQGAVETWKAKKEIIISGKTIHELDYRLNGKDLGMLDRADRTTRRIVITKDGVSIKK